MRDFESITHLTFDCYGTLIDWESGIASALQPIFAAHGIEVSSEKIVERYVAHEARVESQGWRPYRDILQDATVSMAAELGIRLRAEECSALSESIGSWPSFADTVPALNQLKQRFRLAIVSNVDDTLFTETAKQLQVNFDEVITAEQVRSYKPGHAHFREALRRLNVPVDRILHVAQSLYHDHVPAKQLGFRTAWINRPGKLRPLSLPQPVRPDLVVADMAELVQQLG
jgi:2-haloacid dehalogenase